MASVQTPAATRAERTVRLVARPVVSRFVRYSAVSAIALPVAQVVLWLGHSVFGIPAVVANIIAVGAGAIPSYALNRRWVWGRVGSHSFSREVVPFWMYTFFGLALSTFFVAIADRVWGTSLAVAAANIAGFGVLWFSKFLLLERVLFIDRGRRADV
jgi:putative flippase GtrA